MKDWSVLNLQPDAPREIFIGGLSAPRFVRRHKVTLEIPRMRHASDGLMIRSIRASTASSAFMKTIDIRCNVALAPNATGVALAPNATFRRTAGFDSLGS